MRRTPERPFPTPPPGGRYLVVGPLWRPDQRTTEVEVATDLAGEVSVRVTTPREPSTP
jgi:hypothetical protein